MNWPQDHTERMTALWNEGLSGAQVAHALNLEFRTSYSRSAVIGRIHRMGLPKRPKDTWLVGQRIESRRRAGAARIARANAPPKPKPEPKPRHVYLRYAMTAPVAPVLPSTLQSPAPPPPPPVEDKPGLATVLSIQSHMCRWPIGDPQDADFTLCGQRKADGGPYCAGHAARAVKPMPPGKKATNELIRSLRRYTGQGRSAAAS